MSPRGLRRRLAVPMLGLALVGLGASLPAAAQEDEGDRLVLRAVDARDPEAVSAVVSWGGEADAIDTIEVQVQGDAAETEVVSLADAGRSNDIVFVVDSSASTDADGLLTSVKEAIADFTAELPADSRVAVVTAGAVGQTIQNLTTDSAALAEAALELTPDGQGGVLEGLVRGAGIITRAVDAGSIGTIVLFTDGVAEESVELDDARGSVLDAGVVLHVIGLDVDGFDDGIFTDLTEATSGSLTVVAEASGVGSALEDLRPELAQLVVARFVGVDARGVQDLRITLGDQAVSGSYVASGDIVGPGRLEPRPGVEPSGPSFLRSDSGRYLAYGGVLVATMLFAFGLALVFVRDDTGLNAVLQPYSEGYVAQDGEVEAPEGNQAFAQTALLKRAVNATESFADRQGFLTRVERTLEKADLPLRAGEAMFFYLAVLLLVLVLSLGLTGNPLGALVISLFALLIPPAVVNILAARKKKSFEAQLPDTLQLLSSTLRAGYSMMQGVEAVSQEAPEPMGKELRRVVTEARLGRPLEESLEGIAERMESRDFGWAVMAIRIQREVGGNLSELLMTVAETMTQRERLRRDIQALTAEGRISAYILGGLPVALGGLLYTFNPDYIGKLFEVATGQLALGAALLMMLVGFAWMFKIIRIEL